MTSKKKNFELFSEIIHLMDNKVGQDKILVIVTRTQHANQGHGFTETRDMIAGGESPAGKDLLI